MSRRFRWPALALVFWAMFFYFKGPSSSENRGVEFYREADRLADLPKECRVLTLENRVSAYSMEAYSLWYWKGRAWERISKEPSSRVAVPFHALYWDPQNKVLWGNGSCKPRI